MKLNRKIWILLVISMLNQTAIAQNLTKLWTGLTSPQSELPQGKAALQKAERITPINIPTKLISTNENEWIISDGWRMIDNDALIESGAAPLDPKLDVSDWYNATVPGTVLTTLVDQGVYPDPYFGLNNMAIPESLCRTDWWYSVNFDAPKSSKERKSLLFNGINYKAAIYLNGKRIGEMKGAFIRGEFDVTGVIKDNDNILIVHIYPPANPGIPHEQTMKLGQGLNGGMLSNDGPTFISSIGWDWVPGIRDRNIGIWQDVRIRTTDDVVIGDPLVATNLSLPDTTSADITIKVPIKNMGNKNVSGVVVAQIEDIKVEKRYSLKANQEIELILTPDEFSSLKMKKPRLWWPNGYGKPELYNMDLSVTSGDQESDLKSIRFGIRELSYELMVANADSSNTRYAYTPVDRNDTKVPLFDYVNRIKYSKLNSLPTIMSDDLSGLEELDANDPMGPYIVIRVNGVRIFCRGGNWGMDDAMKRVERERLEPYFRLHKEANFNMIRNWTGESTEEIFYSLCDEYGMLVWNDFWITTDDTVEPYDQVLFVDNARDVVRRFRNHPSIVIWNPRNEGFAPKGLDVMLPQMIAEEDNTRHYHGQSRYLNMDGSGPWGYFKNPADYYTKNAKGFNTEMGTYAIPTANTLKKFIAKEDQWPINDVWAYHDLHHTTQNFPDFIDAVNSFGEPKSMEEFAAQAQFICYDAWRDMLEAWNSKMWNNTSGLILWMTHPAWPSMIWQTYTYDYETPGSFYGAKKACEPIHVQMNLPNNDIVIINTTQNDLKKATVTATYYNLNGEQIYRDSKKISLAKANSLTNCFVPKQVDSKIYLARIELKDRKGKLISINDYIKTDDKGNNRAIKSVAKASVEYKISGNKIVLTNTSNSIALSLKVSVKDRATGDLILPAYISDGFINLMPKEKRALTFDVPNRETKEVEFIVEGYNL